MFSTVRKDMANLWDIDWCWCNLSKLQLLT